MCYSKIDFTHKLDRTTVTVGAPSMLAISTNSASAGTSSSAWATTGSTAPVVAEGSDLLSSVDARGSPATVACCAVSGTTASTVGAGLGSSQLLLSPCPSCLRPPDPRGQTMEYLVTTPNSNFSTQYSKTSTQLHYSRNSPHGQLFLSPLASWQCVFVLHCAASSAARED
jgi:hypothetical protein